MEQFAQPNGETEVFMNPETKLTTEGKKFEDYENMPSAPPPPPINQPQSATTQQMGQPNKMSPTGAIPDAVYMFSYKNPNPIAICAIIVLVIIFLNLLRKTMLKRNLSGAWIDANRTEHSILHNTMYNSILLDNALRAKFKKGIIIVERGKMFGYLHGNKIVWTTGDIWFKVMGL